MKTSDTSETGLELIIVNSLIKEAGYQQGDPKDFKGEYALDFAKLLAFLKATQPETVEALGLELEGPKQNKFLGRLQGEITKRGIVSVLRQGIKHESARVELFYSTPSRRNRKAAELFAANIFSVTRQLHYSPARKQLALDLAIFINGLPVATFELKNQFTKQNVRDAVKQYKSDRDPKELLFQFGRCAVHFALDDAEVRMTTHLQGQDSWFLPFNKGHNDGAGNPPNEPNSRNSGGIATDYLWKEILSKEGLADILENYAQIVEEKDQKTGKKKKKQIFPRYHQLAVVRALLRDAKKNGVGKRYLIQHSAGSGKSNSIAWLAHQLVGLEREGKILFDSIIVVSDRLVLDQQIQKTIKQFLQVSATVGHAAKAENLRQFLQSGKKIIIATVQKFPFILDAIGKKQGQNFAIIIDEAHSSQGGKTAASMNEVLGLSRGAEGARTAVESQEQDKVSPAGSQPEKIEEIEEEIEEETTEDKIIKIIEGRKMLANASYFAFTATPKNKTLEIFGEPDPEGDKVKHRPFHSYTMKQAIQEGFILDVLEHYTPVESYYRLAKVVEDDPLFDTKKAQKKLRQYVEGHDRAIRKKAEIMVDNFQTMAIARQKIGGKARAMVVTKGVKEAIQYFYAFRDYLKECGSPYRPIVAFSGDREYGGKKVSEATINGFPSSQIEDKIKEDPYRFLIVAGKYQTGYDEPLLYAMYVDKRLSDIKAVQTLSRLNRAHPQKHDTLVLDLYNSTETIKKAFERYYRATILSDESDPNKLHDLKADLDGYRIYAQEQIDRFVGLYLGDAERDRLDPILDVCVATYKADLEEGSQLQFKSKAKAFARAYNFLSSILPFSNAEWEKLSIFLNFLIPKLPASREEDLSRGILEAIDIDSYRVEVKSTFKIALAEDNQEVDPMPSSGGDRQPEPELDPLSKIIREFNELFGNIEWEDKDKTCKAITEEIPAKVSADKSYQNAMKNSDEQNARIEHDRALQRVVQGLLEEHLDLLKQFSDNMYFKEWLSDKIFGATYRKG
ncbi:MAG: type I restriction endonuclease subunit R [Oscillatoria sp. SIO1A7]|nr:type I restriction endonuclease subunit R [Oscillatoria sp. SIO1A7]